MAGQSFRGKPTGGSKDGGLTMKGKPVEPTALGSLLDDMDSAFGDIEKLEHDALWAAMTEEEQAEAGLDEGEGEGEGEGEEQAEGQGSKRRGERWGCYCGNPTCTIAFSEGRQVRREDGRFDRFGSPLSEMD